MNHLLLQTVYERVKNAKTAENAMQLYLNNYLKYKTKISMYSTFGWQITSSSIGSTIMFELSKAFSQLFEMY